MTYKLHGIKTLSICLFCKLMYPKDTEQRLVHGKCSINISTNGARRAWLSWNLPQEQGSEGSARGRGPERHRLRAMEWLWG